jgi:8-amino-7-oxononanoate synthase
MFHVKRPSPLAHLGEALAELERAGLRRAPPAPRPSGALSFCSNDYLGLAAELAAPASSGAGGSRLIAGDRAEHRATERAFARWLEAADGLLFTSGYAANVGVLSALARPGDVVVSDALNHASIIDGARLSRAEVVVVPHLDVDAVRKALEARAGRRAWVVTESYFSMDADAPDLAALRRVCDASGAALVVDEAHALGVLGPGGRGLCAAAGVVADVLVAPLGKAFGGQGAVVLGESLLREWLWNRARSFVFSTGLAPACAATALRALERVRAEPERAARVARLAQRLREGLGALGVRTGAFEGVPAVLGFGHVVPLVVGSAARALALAAQLQASGVDVLAVRPPTVPEGTARVRLTVTARHDDVEVDRAIAAVAEAMAKLSTA